MLLLQSTIFKKQIKKLHKNQIKDLAAAVKVVVKDPSIGEMKKGDLIGIQVYKFKMAKQLILLAYEYIDNELTLVLLSCGSHENFYRDLKR